MGVQIFRTAKSCERKKLRQLKKQLKSSPVKQFQEVPRSICLVCCKNQQLRAGVASPSQARAAQYLQDEATRLNSRVLSALAVRAEADPFAKVKKMIKDLIVRLMEEANEEAEH